MPPTYGNHGRSRVRGDAAVRSAAVAVQYEVMKSVRDAVVDSALWTDRSEPELVALGVPMIQVYCECPFEVARRRFFDRQSAGDRHPGFSEHEMTDDDDERLRPLCEPLRLPVPLVRVDTTGPIPDRAVDRILSVAAAADVEAPTR